MVPEPGEHEELVQHRRTLKRLIALLTQAQAETDEPSRQMAVDLVEDFLAEKRSHLDDALGDSVCPEAFVDLGTQLVDLGKTDRVHVHLMRFSSDVNPAFVEHVAKVLAEIEDRILPRWSQLNTVQMKIVKHFCSLQQGTRLTQEAVLLATQRYVTGRDQRSFRKLHGKILGRDGERGRFYLERLPRDMPDDIPMHPSWMKQ